jgi:hypothetical protein
MLSAGWFMSDMWRFFCLYARSGGMAGAEEFKFVLRTPWVLRGSVVLASGAAALGLAAVWRGRGRYRVAGVIETIAAGAYVVIWFLARAGWSPALLILPLVKGT